MGKKIYRYILFDLDGTLTDPGEGITNSVAYALSKWGIEVEDKRSLYPFIGPPLAGSFTNFYGFSEDDALRAVEAYREYYRDRGIFENLVYPGIPEVLSKLCEAGKDVILATSKPEFFAKQILEHFGLDGCFACIAGATMDSSRTKKGDVIAYALEKHGVTDRTACLMIGDRDVDIYGAAKNGMDSLGVLYGYGDLQELEGAGATYIAEHAEDILKFC